jgi:hypothetical protein
MSRSLEFSSLYLRIALGTSFLSAVADRLGLWGGFWPAQRLLGEFRAVRCVHRNAQLVFAQGDHSGLGHHSDWRRSLVGPLPYRWVANAHGRMGGRNSSHHIRNRNGGGFGI